MSSRVWSIWEAMIYRKHGLGVSLIPYQLSNPSHHNSSDLTFHIYEMGIINLSSKDYHKHKMKLFCFSSHRGISEVCIWRSYSLEYDLWSMGISGGSTWRNLKHWKLEGRLSYSSQAQLVTAWLWLCLFFSIPSTTYCLIFPFLCQCYSQTIIFMPRA